MDLRYIIVKVEDTERAKNFYTRLIGEEPVKEEGERMVEFQFEAVKIGLYNPSQDEVDIDETEFGNNCIPAFGVDNLESELDRISKFSDILSRHEVGEHRWFTFQDTEGNILEVHQT